MNLKLTLWTLLLFGATSALAAAEPPDWPEVQAGQWPIDKLKSAVPAVRVLDDSVPIHALLYEGLPINGKQTEVFAFFASPATLGTAKEGVKFPGIVLIHGGGGTAFSDWVWLWAQRGYAAIAMDLSGRRPPQPKFDDAGQKVADLSHPRGQRTRLANAGLDHTHVEKFHNIGGTVEDDWPFHAAANVIRAHTLLRSFRDVDADRTAVTGISWGGYTTCLVASLDDRFKAAVPVYGCGFLHEGESVQKPHIDRLGDRRDAWIAAYDPSSHLAKCTVPTFWVNGTHDIHYVLDSYAKSYGLVKGPKTIRIEHRMRHSHGAGWAPKEIGIYVDSVLKSGTPLPKVGSLQTSEDGTVSAEYTSATKIAGANLIYTADAGPRSKRKWITLPARVTSDQVIAEGLPEEANTWLLTVTDQRDAMVSSAVGFR